MQCRRVCMPGMQGVAGCGSLQDMACTPEMRSHHALETNSTRPAPPQKQSREHVRHPFKPSQTVVRPALPERAACMRHPDLFSRLPRADVPEGRAACRQRLRMPDCGASPCTATNTCKNA